MLRKVTKYYYLPLVEMKSREERNERLVMSLQSEMKVLSLSVSFQESNRAVTLLFLALVRPVPSPTSPRHRFLVGKDLLTRDKDDNKSDPFEL